MEGNSWEKTRGSGVGEWTGVGRVLLVEWWLVFVVESDADRWCGSVLGDAVITGLRRRRGGGDRRQKAPRRRQEGTQQQYSSCFVSGGISNCSGRRHYVQHNPH